MELNITAAVLQDMVSRSIKGVGNDKLIPITTKLAIELKDGVLTLTSTDYTNYLYVTKSDVKGDDFYIVIEADKFSKLISKMTCENICLQVEENALVVKGNGTHKIEIPLDESTGLPITFPNPAANLELPEDKKVEVNLSTLKLIVDSCKSSLAVTFEDPQYTGYYLGDRVITTDRQTISGLNKEILPGEKLLAYPKFMELISVLTSDKVSVYSFDDNLVIISPECSIYGKGMEGVDSYEADTIASLLDTPMDNNCSVNTAALLGVLDRASLFLGQYDNSAIKLDFLKDGLQVESIKADSCELIPYISKLDGEEFSCHVDASLFEQLLKSYSNESVTIEYGDDSAIKLVDGDLTFVLCLLDDDEIESI